MINEAIEMGDSKTGFTLTCNYCKSDATIHLDGDLFGGYAKIFCISCDNRLEHEPEDGYVVELGESGDEPE